MLPLAAMGVTFVTYVMADTASNSLQHFPQKLDYGKTINRLLGGRPVEETDNEFWGTRTEHIVGVAAALTATDYLSQAAWKKILKTSAFSFASHPAQFLAHTYIFIAAGVAAYCGVDALFNPDHEEGSRGDVFYQNLNSTIIGSLTAFHEPFWGALALALAPTVVGGSWFLTWLFTALIPATLAYATVKGVGWNDWGSSGLNAVEKRFNA